MRALILIALVGCGGDAFTTDGPAADSGAQPSALAPDPSSDGGRPPAIDAPAMNPPGEAGSPPDVVNPVQPDAAPVATTSQDASPEPTPKDAAPDAPEPDAGQPQPSCLFTCTSGCCDSAGTCQPGNENTVCGNAGGLGSLVGTACEDCTTTSRTCVSGKCQSG